MPVRNLYLLFCLCACVDVYRHVLLSPVAYSQLMVESDDLNSTSITVHRGKIQPVVYKFTYPNEEGASYNIQFYNNSAITDCDTPIKHTIIKCSSSSVVTEHHVLLIDAADVMNMTRVTCQYHTGDIRHRFPCPNVSSFTVIITGGNVLCQI